MRFAFFFSLENIMKESFWIINVKTHKSKLLVSCNLQIESKWKTFRMENVFIYSMGFSWVREKLSSRIQELFLWWEKKVIFIQLIIPNIWMGNKNFLPFLLDLQKWVEEFKVLFCQLEIFWIEMRSNCVLSRSQILSKIEAWVP